MVSNPPPPPPPPKKKKKIFPQQVTRFVCEFLKLVVPLKLWGSIDNRTKVLRHVATFVCLTRYASISLDRIMEGVQVSVCGWAAPKHGTLGTTVSPSDLQCRTRLVRALIRWLFENIVVTLIRTHFYATETSVHRNAVFYFRKVRLSVQIFIWLMPKLPCLVQQSPCGDNYKH